MLKKLPRIISDKELIALLENTGVTLAKREKHSFSRTGFLVTHLALMIFFINLLLRIFNHQ